MAGVTKVVSTDPDAEDTVTKAGMVAREVIKTAEDTDQTMAMATGTKVAVMVRTMDTEVVNLVEALPATTATLPCSLETSEMLIRE